MPGSCYCGRREVGTIGNAANVVLAVVVAAGLAGPAAAPLHAADRPAPADRPPVVALPEPLTREAIRELVARLSDADVRQLLVAQLDHAAVTPPAAATAPGMAPMMGDMEAETDRLRRAGRATVMAAAELPRALAPLTDGRSATDLLRAAVLLGAAVALVFVGLLVLMVWQSRADVAAWVVPPGGAPQAAAGAAAAVAPAEGMP